MKLVVVNAVNWYKQMKKSIDDASELKRLSYYDQFTNLPNRLLFYETLLYALKRAGKSRGMFAVFLLNLNRFKTINEMFGYVVGDRLLKEASVRMKKVLPKKAFLAKMEGDEFAVLLPDMTNRDEAVRLANAIEAVLKKPFIENGHRFQIGVSSGISLYPNHAGTYESLMKTAYIAMYRAKSRGFSSHCFYAPTMGEQASRRFVLENDLLKAIKNGEFTVFYQPRMNRSAKKIVGMEALVRWRHPSLGLIGQDDFIPLAEETGLIVPLGEWVLREACLQNRMWHDEGYGHLSVSVNLSARQIQEDGFAEKVDAILKETQLDGKWLECEITENILIEKETIETLRKLKKFGIQLSIDDFGTGYSSLRYLQLFPIDMLKIDRSFVKGIHEPNEKGKIVKAIISLAHSLDVKVAAEGVENKEQLRFLQRLLCHELQGFMFSKPLPSFDFEKLLRNGTISS